MTGWLTRKSLQTIGDLIVAESFCIILKDALSSLITKSSKYFDIVVELHQKTWNTFSNLTQKKTELNKNILVNSNIIIEAFKNMNRNENSNIPRNDNNLDTVPKTTEKIDANVQVEL